MLAAECLAKAMPTCAAGGPCARHRPQSTSYQMPPIAHGMEKSPHGREAQHECTSTT